MSEERIKYLEGRVEALISLNDALVSGLDIRSQINRDLKEKLGSPNDSLCPFFRAPCKRDRCVAYKKQEHADTWKECKALNVIMV